MLIHLSTFILLQQLIGEIYMFGVFIPISTSINIKQIISELPVTLRIGIIALILFGICYVIASLDMSKKVNFKIKNTTME